MIHQPSKCSVFPGLDCFHFGGKKLNMFDAQTWRLMECQSIA